MQTSSYTNIAFISYKREDEEWAKWLQKKLEHYKLPIEIRKQNPDLEFVKNPRHVFRDTTDLSGGVLAKAIKEGLASSKFLIVLCSPRAAKSEWVCKEVQEFIDSGREEYIIPFIIDGEPYAKNPENECFPEVLKTLTGEQELLGIDINVNGRDSAAVKVVAYMFNLKFDTLWNRFQRDAIRKRRFTIVGLILSIVVLLGIVIAGAWSYREVKSANHMMMESRSRAIAEKARQKIAGGDVYNAMIALLKVLPEDKNDNEIPYTPEAEAALRIALDSCYSSSWKKFLLSDADKYLFSPNGQHILSILDEDSISLLKILDANSLNDICNIQLQDEYSYISCSDDETRICIGIDDRIEVYDTRTGKLVQKGNVGDSNLNEILISYIPIEIKDFLQFGIREVPNTLTLFFKPENSTSNVQVIDYLPQKSLILYKSVKNIGADEYTFQESYKLWNNYNDKVVWELIDTVYINNNIVHVNLSHNGNHIIISYIDSFDVIDTDDLFPWNVNTNRNYVTHEAKMTKDENYIFEYLPRHSFVTNIYDVSTLEIVDSINANPLMPESASFNLKGDKFIINYMHQSDYRFQSYLYFKTNHLLKEPQDISPSLIYDNINNHISRTKKSNNDSILVFDDYMNHKWECINARFIGYTEDMQYVAVEKRGLHFLREYQLLEINSGLCMYKWTTKNLEDAKFNFLPYKDLLKTCRSIVQSIKISDASIRDFYLY